MGPVQSTTATRAGQTEPATEADSPQKWPRIDFRSSSWSQSLLSGERAARCVVRIRSQIAVAVRNAQVAARFARIVITPPILIVGLGEMPDLEQLDRFIGMGRVLAQPFGQSDDNFFYFRTSSKNAIARGSLLWPSQNIACFRTAGFE
jgi:hypothetical protein